MSEERDDGMKVVVEKRAAAPLLPIRDIVAARATIVLPRLLQQGNGSRAIAVIDVSIINKQYRVEKWRRW